MICQSVPAGHRLRGPLLSSESDMLSVAGWWDIYSGLKSGERSEKREMRKNTEMCLFFKYLMESQNFGSSFNLGKF